MTDATDILGRPPRRRSVDESADADLSGPTIADLAKPLSATVMPRRAMFSAGGGIMTEADARRTQRKVNYHPKPYRGL
ncbi:MAG: hypothetical protein RI571_15860 [Roseovarius sp.]|nr:hypothetical protein [Roseovarius sp.]